MQLDDRAPPEALLVLLRGVRHQAGELEPVQPALHALAVALDEPRDGLLVAAVGDSLPAHDRREADDKLRERAAVARRAATAGPLLPSPPPPQIAQHRDHRGLKPRVPLKRPTALLAGLPDGGQDLHADRLRRQRGGVAKGPARLRAGRARSRMTGDCHRQRRERRSRRQSAHEERRPSAIGQQRTATGQGIPSGPALEFPAVLRAGFGRAPVALSGTRPHDVDRAATRSSVVKARLTEERLHRRPLGPGVRRGGPRVRAPPRAELSEHDPGS